jgi:FkbM family methyltransferase
MEPLHNFGIQIIEMITYAQNFEDVMLERLFKDQVDGFYVDIGAWHPSLYSVTKHFYDKGWHGINVEPIRGQFELFEVDRPRDVNLNLAVSEAAGTVRFFECSDDTSLSTVSAEQAEALRQAGHTLVEYDVETTTLGEVAARFCPAVIDFLKVDVEGAEANVLQGVDWSNFRPRVLVIEATKPATPIKDWGDIEAIANWQEWEPLLLEKGYLFAYFDGLSRFYVREEDCGIMSRLTLPPGVFDRIQPSDNEGLVKHLEIVEADRAARLTVIEQLSQQLEIVEADRAARLVVIEQLSQQLEVVEADRAARLTVIEQLSQQLEHLEAEKSKYGWVVRICTFIHARIWNRGKRL